VITTVTFRRLKCNCVYYNNVWVINEQSHLLYQCLGDVRAIALTIVTFGRCASNRAYYITGWAMCEQSHLL